jgi:hypothetical protein
LRLGGAERSGAELSVATVQVLLYQSPPNGSRVYINYDDVTMLASGLSLTCGAGAVSALGVQYTLAGVTSFVSVPKATALHTVNFATPIAVVAGTDSHGNPNLTFVGLTAVGGSHGPPAAV